MENNFKSKTRTLSKLLIICICIGGAGTMLPSLNKMSHEEVRGDIQERYSGYEPPDIKDPTPDDYSDNIGGDQTVGGDGLQMTEELRIAPSMVEEADFAEFKEFDYGNAIAGGVFGYLLTNGLDLLKKLFGLIIGFIRRKK